jgi:hypothetical protein
MSSGGPSNTWLTALTIPPISCASPSSATSIVTIRLRRLDVHEEHAASQQRAAITHELTGPFST